jgi:hypothetical protein
MPVVMPISRELKIIDNPKLIKKRFLVGDLRNKNKKLKAEVIIRLPTNTSK